MANPLGLDLFQHSAGRPAMSWRHAINGCEPPIGDSGFQ